MKWEQYRDEIVLVEIENINRYELWHLFNWDSFYAIKTIIDPVNDLLLTEDKTLPTNWILT